MLGIFQMGTSNTSGYGYLSMNLNALFNPVSLGPNWWVPGKGEIIWSSFLPVRALTNNNIESFNYLGLGVLLSLFSMVCFIAYRLIKNFNMVIHNLIGLIKRHFFLTLFMCFTTIFAVTNVVCAFSYVILTIPLPESLLNIFNAFRASGRLFWSVNYILVTISLLFILYILKEKKRLCTVFLIGMLSLQIIDLSPALLEKHESFQVEQSYYNQVAVDEIIEIIGEHDGIFYLELIEDRAL